MTPRTQRQIRAAITARDRSTHERQRASVKNARHVRLVSDNDGSRRNADVIAPSLRPELAAFFLTTPEPKRSMPAKPSSGRLAELAELAEYGSWE